jgi:hypothetical protein
MLASTETSLGGSKSIDIELARRRALSARDLVRRCHALGEIGKQLLVHRLILPMFLRRRTPLLRLPTLFRIGSEAIADRIGFAGIGDEASQQSMALSRGLRRECCDHRGLGHSLYSYCFAPACMSGCDSHSRLGDVESFGNEGNQRRVRGAVDWRRREADSNEAVVHARNFRLASARLNVDANGGGLGHGRFTNCLNRLHALDPVITGRAGFSLTVVRRPWVGLFLERCRTEQRISPRTHARRPREPLRR